MPGNRIGDVGAMTVVVRHGRWEDLEALVALDPAAGPGSARQDRLRRGLGCSRVHVAVLGGVPRGYALLHDQFYGHPFLELLFVGEDQRRTGMGTGLIRYALEHARGSRLFTSTNQSNTPMQALLGKFGFEPSGIIHNLDPGDPELVYCISLDGLRRTSNRDIGGR